MQNPLRRERLELQLSPEQMANIANIQTAAIGQAEEGFYQKPLPSYMIALGIQPGSPREKRLFQEYYEYQLWKRQSNGANSPNPKLILNPQFSLEANPLVSWRTQSGLATYGLCSAFCLHMPLVNKVEKQILDFTEVPPIKLIEPLTDAGYGSSNGPLEEFIEAMRIYKITLSNKIRASNNLPPVGAFASTP